ncbi:MAG TPA: hopanoid-associated sugar epimerase [Acidocella sp.]|jgi:dihydroflavonol-4-reductase|uniref:hopanoid-associated sugar epimerase n=1 Tax=Acidocella sp. TaxID=50710 RepID=UPI002C8472D8|nr:hopanoid-associated sugar epimerase [Acidocella sp.]HVE21296.1 hopanoid-associated sugar epimerase [Acidocella sp.]
MGWGLGQGDLTLVTGATGFVGAAVARALAASGHRLRLAVRRGSDRRNVKDIAAELVEFDLAEPASFAPALAGCRYLFHVAADYRLWVPDVASMRRVNIDGTVALLRAAAGQVERSIYTSSVAALGLTADGSPADETTEIKPAHHVGAYKKSKYDAEQAVRALAAAGQNIVIVNPTAPVGPGDVKPTPTGQMILDAARGNMPAYVDTGLNVAHVDDVAAGHLLALEKGVAGEAYILGSENLMLRELLALIAAQAGRKPPAWRLPIGPLMPLAWAMEHVANVTGKPPLMTPDILAMARKKMFFSSAKAQRELGYAPRPAASAVAAALAWFRTEGYLT